MTADGPTLRAGKLCYVEIPSTDIARSARFYEQVFGWHIRRRDDGSIAFEDTVNEVSKTWVLGRPPTSEPGLVVYVMVADAAAAVASIVAGGGDVVRPIDPAGHEVFAWFRDPGGNVLGVYQQPGLAEDSRSR
jgi:predicted enzyme related to lactoylglutathione lyase